MADLGEGPGRPAPPYFGKKKLLKKTQKEEKPAGQAIFANQFCFNISKKPSPPLAQGLDPPLKVVIERGTSKDAFSIPVLQLLQLLNNL